jgi:hypothetical protein
MVNVRNPEIIDAEFTVVGEPAPQSWNGLGLPPSWHTWGFIPRVVYVVVWLSIMTGAWIGAHWLGQAIFPLRH